MDSRPRRVSQVSRLSWELPTMLHLLCEVYHGQKLVSVLSAPQQGKNELKVEACHIMFSLY